MANSVETEINVQRFGFTGDEAGKRLHFPRAVTHNIQGRSGDVAYGATEAVFDGLEGRLDTLRWTSEAASIGGAWLKDDRGRFDISVDRLEMPNGIMLTRADNGVELVAPHVTLSEMKLTIRGPFGSDEAAPAPEPGEVPALRQDGLGFLDSLSGRIYLTVKVVLDLPVIGKRTLDQQLKVPIQEGRLDFRALDKSLDWLEGAFLDIKHHDDKLSLAWKVPIFGSSHELISWKLDAEATAIAAFGKVPVRALADYTIGDGQPSKPDDKKRKTLQALTLEAIDIAISLLAPHSVDVGGGLIQFGGEDQPGMVDLKVTGSIDDRGPGTLRGAIGSIDTTIKDLHLGPAEITADRMHFDGLDELEVTFDGFRPASVSMTIHRVTATNLALRIGG